MAYLDATQNERGRDQYRIDNTYPLSTFKPAHVRAVEPGVGGLGVRVRGFRFWGSNFWLRVWGLGFRVEVWGLGVWGLRSRVYGLGIKVQGSEFTVQDLGFGVWGLGFSVSDLGLRFQG